MLPMKSYPSIDNDGDFSLKAKERRPVGDLEAGTCRGNWWSTVWYVVDDLAPIDVQVGNRA